MILGAVLILIPGQPNFLILAIIVVLALQQSTTQFVVCIMQPWERPAFLLR